MAGVQISLTEADIKKYLQEVIGEAQQTQD
jgi:hypothetical protein